MLESIKILLLISCVFIVGCRGNNNKNCSTERSTAVELVDEFGLVLQPSNRMFVSPNQITKFYQDTMSCVGLTARGPTVAFRSFSDNFIGATWAFYLADGETVWINSDRDETWLPRDCKTDEEALKHEFIHHILNMNNIPNNRHQTTLFNCGLGVNTSN